MHYNLYVSSVSVLLTLSNCIFCAHVIYFLVGVIKFCTFQIDLNVTLSFLTASCFFRISKGFAAADKDSECVLGAYREPERGPLRGSGGCHERALRRRETLRCGGAGGRAVRRPGGEHLQPVNTHLILITFTAYFITY